MIATGAVLFVIGEVMEHMGVNGYAPAIVNVIAYLILGLEIVITAVKNLTHGQVFDENFLMSIATLGAFAVGDFSEAVGVMLFYRIGEFFEDIAVERSRNQIMDAVDLRPETVNLVSGNDIRVIPAEETEVGDVLLVRPGDRIPLDGTILEGDSRLDTSAITGEPVPVTVKKGDEIVSGCVNVSGQLKIRVDKPLSESMVTRILDFCRKCRCKQTKDRPFYYKIRQSLHSICRCSGTGNCHYPVTGIRELVLLGTHRTDLPGYQLSMCAGT